MYAARTRSASRSAWVGSGGVGVGGTAATVVGVVVVVRGVAKEAIDLRVAVRSAEMVSSICWCVWVESKCG